MQFWQKSGNCIFVLNFIHHEWTKPFITRVLYALIQLFCQNFTWHGWNKEQTEWQKRVWRDNCVGRVYQQWKIGCEIWLEHDKNGNIKIFFDAPKKSYFTEKWNKTVRSRRWKEDTEVKTEASTGGEWTKS